MSLEFYATFTVLKLKKVKLKTENVNNNSLYNLNASVGLIFDKEGNVVEDNY